MSGQITGVTTISVSAGLFGPVTWLTTNDTNVTIPSVGVAGGIGDKIILYAGTSTVYPYSFGINTNPLWYWISSTFNYITSNYILFIWWVSIFTSTHRRFNASAPWV